jgi:hypothetical protein
LKIKIQLLKASNNEEFILNDFKNLIKTHATFLDESYDGTSQDDIVVTAQVPFDLDIRWFFELKKRLGKTGELKYSDVRKNWKSFDNQMKGAIKNGVGQALIVVCDPQPYTKPAYQVLSRISSGLPQSFLKEIKKNLSDIVQQGVLEQSPVSWIKYNISANAPNNAELQKRLKKPHNIKLFVARSIATFHELYDKENWDHAFDELLPQRFVLPQHIYANILLKSQEFDRVFDEGNRPSAELIREIRNQVDERINDYIITVPGEMGKVEEVNSKDNDYIQVSDLAAGFARDMYQKPEGKKRLKDYFKATIYNGKLL